jgi:4'-phosphopantetheinyl transferase
MNKTPRPCDGEVHIFCLTLTRQPSELSRLGLLLSSSETERAGLLKSELAKKRYIAGCGMLRKIMGGYLGLEPEDVRIAAGEHGKPFLANVGENLRYNLSHSGDMFVLAVATGIEVGVDIEKVEADKPFNDMARIVFSCREQEEIFSLPTSDMLAAAFYRCWVRKEACLKACGSGFSLPGNSFDVSPNNELTASQPVRCDKSCWHVLDIDVPQYFCAALAVEARSPALPPPKLVRIAHPLSCV